MVKLIKKVRRVLETEYGYTPDTCNLIYSDKFHEITASKASTTWGGKLYIDDLEVVLEQPSPAKKGSLPVCIFAFQKKQGV